MASGDDNNTVFGKILRGEIPCNFIYEDDKCVAFKDIAPQAPVHFLVIPRKFIPKLGDIHQDDEQLLGHLLWAANHVASTMPELKDGYRLVVNNDKAGGQEVFHLHLHVLGGKHLGWPPFPQ